MGSEVSGGVSAVANYEASKDAAKNQQFVSNMMTLQMIKAAKEITAASNSYIKEMQSFAETFDPKDFTNAYADLYESVILPMDRDFQENVMPAIDTAYAGFGGGLNSGAYKETVANTKQQAAETKSMLRATERDKAYAENIDTYNRRMGELSATLSAKTMGPNARAGMLQPIYSVQTDSIAAGLAAAQAGARIPTAVQQGVNNTIQTTLQAVNTVSNMKSGGMLSR